jgi:hypothetical protein
MTEQQFNYITAWQKETFPKATPFSKICHLEQEVAELKHDLIDKADGRRLEFADCFLLLFGAAHADGMSYNDILEAINEKMQINIKRAWGKPDENGVVNHVKN